MDRRVSRRRAHLRLSAARRACAALLLAAPLASCLIPEPKASHSSDEIGEISPSIFAEDPGPASEPELGLPVAPPTSAAPAGEVAAINGESSAASETEAAQPADPAASSSGTGESQPQSAPAEGQPETSSPPAEPAPAEQDPSAAPTEAGNAPNDPQAAPQGQEPAPEGQEPAPPDLPTAPASGANGPALAQAPKEVYDLLQQYYAAFSKRDWVAAAACFWDGAIISSLGLRGNENASEPVKAITLPARTFFETLIKDESALEPVVGQFGGAPVVQRSGDVVQAWCRYEAQYGPENEKMSWRRYDSVVLIKHQEVWKIFSLAQSQSVEVP